MPRPVALIAALLLAWTGATALAGPAPLPPPESKDVQWWQQFPDLSNEARPRKLGVYFAPDTHPHGNCTVHVFRFLPDRDVLTTAWYSAGSWVVDLSGPAPAGELDNRAAKPGQRTTWGRTLGFAVMPGADTWATKSPGLTPDGRLFMYSGDMARGMDVLEFTGRLPAAHRQPRPHPHLHPTDRPDRDGERD